VFLGMNACLKDGVREHCLEQAIAAVPLATLTSTAYLRSATYHHIGSCHWSR